MLKIAAGQPMPTHDILAMPSYGLNHRLGGGLWTGRFSLVWGTPSAGKTTMLLHTLAEANRNGYHGVIVDTEGSITDPWMEKCGIDINNRTVLQSTIVEEVLKEITPMMKDDKQKYIFLIDSLNNLVPEAFHKEAEGSGGIAIGARARRLLIQKMSKYMSVDNAAILVAQQTLDLSGSHPRLMAKIGNYEWHQMTNIIRLFASSAKDSLERDDTSRILNREVTWTIEKSKQSPIEGASGKYWFSPQDAYIDTTKELLDLAVKNNIITKGGPWFKYGDDYKAQGFDNICALLEDNEVVVEEIKQKLESIDFITEVDEDA